MITPQDKRADVSTQYSADPDIPQPSGTPLLSEDVMRMFDNLTVNQKPMTQGGLPPNFHYPEVGKGVAVGQMSTSMGSGTIFSPGMGLFPYSAVDAYERDRKQERSEALAKEFEPFDWDRIETINPRFNQFFVTSQLNEFGALKEEYFNKYGSNIKARAAMRADGSLEKLAVKYGTQKKILDNAYTLAQGMFKNKDARYTSPETLKAAYEYINTSWESYDNEQQRVEESLKAAQKFVNYVKVEDYNENLIDTYSGVVFESPIMKAIENGDGRAIRTNVRILNQRLQTEGAAALSQSEEELQRFESAVYNNWRTHMGGMEGIAPNSIMSFDDYFDVVINLLGSKVKYDKQETAVDNVREKREWDLWLYNQKKTAERLTIPTVKTKIFNQDVVMANIPTVKGRKLEIPGTAGGFGWANENGAWKRKDNVQGQITGVVNHRDPQTGEMRTYAVVAESARSITRTTTDYQGAERQETYAMPTGNIVYVDYGSVYGHIKSYLQDNNIDFDLNAINAWSSDGMTGTGRIDGAGVGATANAPRPISGGEAQSYRETQEYNGHLYGRNNDNEDWKLIE